MWAVVIALVLAGTGEPDWRTGADSGSCRGQVLSDGALTEDGPCMGIHYITCDADAGGGRRASSRGDGNYLGGCSRCNATAALATALAPRRTAGEPGDTDGSRVRWITAMASDICAEHGGGPHHACTGPEAGDSTGTGPNGRGGRLTDASTGQDNSGAEHGSGNDGMPEGGVLDRPELADPLTAGAERVGSTLDSASFGIRAQRRHTPHTDGPHATEDHRVQRGQAVSRSALYFYGLYYYHDRSLALPTINRDGNDRVGDPRDSGPVQGTNVFPLPSSPRSSLTLVTSLIDIAATTMTVAVANDGWWGAAMLTCPRS